MIFQYSIQTFSIGWWEILIPGTCVFFSTFSIGYQAIDIEHLSFLLCVFLPMSMHFILDGFKIIWFCEHQSLTSQMSFWSKFSIDDTFLSLAKRSSWQCVICTARSLICRRNNKGHKIEPCDTPAVIDKDIKRHSALLYILKSVEQLLNRSGSNKCIVIGSFSDTSIDFC